MPQPPRSHQRLWSFPNFSPQAPIFNWVVGTWLSPVISALPLHTPIAFLPQQSLVQGLDWWAHCCQNVEISSFLCTRKLPPFTRGVKRSQPGARIQETWQVFNENRIGRLTKNNKRCRFRAGKGTEVLLQYA